MPCLFGKLHLIIVTFALQIDVALDSKKNGNNLFKAFQTRHIASNNHNCHPAHVTASEGSFGSTSLW